MSLSQEALSDPHHDFPSCHFQSVIAAYFVYKVFTSSFSDIFDKNLPGCELHESRDWLGFDTVVHPASKTNTWHLVGDQ